MGALILRVLIIGVIVFTPIMALIYGYKHITKEDFKHTAKFLIGGGITFALVMVLTLMENQ